MIAPQSNADQCADAALSSASDESVASDGCEDVSGSVTTNKNKEDATAAFNDYYKHQAISDDAAALFAKRLPIAVRVNNSSPCAALCTAALTMRPAPVAGRPAFCLHCPAIVWKIVPRVYEDCINCEDKSKYYL